MYIIERLLVILGDTDIRLKLGFFRTTLGTLDNLIWEKTQKADLKGTNTI